jgi:hypothetical protein
MRTMFEHLERLNRPVFVAETGCVRVKDNWVGDGQSTVLLDRFVSCRPGSICHSVDINSSATDLCRSLVSSAVQVHTGDSVQFLRALSRNRPQGFEYLDLLYLDSMDVDFFDPHPSALHHIKELLAASSLIGPQTLVVVDDAPCEAPWVLIDSQAFFVKPPRITGKGKYIAEYADSIGLMPLFHGYQAGWLGM